MRATRILGSVAIGLLGSGLLAELCLRTLLFSDLELARSLGASLRFPSLYADRWDPDFWKLQHVLLDPDRRRSALYDPVLGWKSRGADRAWNRLVLGDRRLVALYGDSFVGCATPPEDCWQGLLDRSDIGGRFGMLNLGVGGYGLDQIWLNVRETVDRYAVYDPIVGVGVFTDDLDRSLLELRNWPRPRVALEDGRLVARAPLAEDAETYVREHPVGIRSYLWRFLLYGTELLPEGWRADPARIRDEASTLAFELVRNVRDELEGRGLDHFFVVFVGRYDVQEEEVWQETALIRAFEALGVPYVNSRDPLLASGDTIDELYNPPHILHYTARGNEVVFEAVRAGILRADGLHSKNAARKSWMPLHDRFRAARVVRRGQGALARSKRISENELAQADDGQHILLRPGADGPTEVVFALNGALVELIAELRPSLSEAPGAGCAVVTTRILVDGTEAFVHATRHGDEPVPIRVDLAGATELTLEVGAHPGPGEACDWVYLSEPRVR